MEERHVSAFKPIECATVLDGSEAVSTERYPIADIARWRKGTSPHSNRLNAQRCSMAVSTERYPIADIARWREGTSPHSNRLNAQRCSMAVSTERYPIADIARWREGTSPHSNRLNAQRCSMAVSTERYPIADIARWREGTFPHSNELNAERRSNGYKSEPVLEVKIGPAPADVGWRICRRRENQTRSGWNSTRPSSAITDDRRDRRHQLARV